MRALVGLIVLAAACGEPKRELQPAKTEPGGGSAPRGSGTGTATGSGAGTEPEPGTGTGTGTGTGSDTEPGAGTVGDVYGSIPAWQAVVDRDRYLLRRNQQAVI